MASQRGPRTAASHRPAESPIEIRHTPSSRTEHQAPDTPSDYEQEIRLHAYQLWEQRGQRDGFAEEDWLDAEKDILDRYKQLAS